MSHKLFIRKFLAIGILAASVSIQSDVAHSYGIQLNTTKTGINEKINEPQSEKSWFGKLLKGFSSVKEETLGAVRERISNHMANSIHENITQQGLRNALEEAKLKYGLLMPAHKLMGSEKYNHVRKIENQMLSGLLWNDDPDGFLMPKSDTNPNGFKALQTGVKWLKEFGITMAKMKAGVSEEDLSTSLLYSSHFGDLQYFHGMGLANQSRDEIKAQMMAYAGFAWKFISGARTFEEQRSRIRAEKFRWDSGDAFPVDEGEKFRARFQEHDLLYHAADNEEMRFRALGSLLHMVQDSYAKGHTVREFWEETENAGKNKENPDEYSNYGRIRYFQSYADQDGGVHGTHDNPLEGQTELDFANIAGASSAVRRSKEIIVFAIVGCQWEAKAGQHIACPENGVKDYFDTDVLDLVPESEMNGESIATRSHPAVAAEMEAHMREEHAAAPSLMDY